MLRQPSENDGTGDTDRAFVYLAEAVSALAGFHEKTGEGKRSEPGAHSYPAGLYSGALQRKADAGGTGGTDPYLQK